MGRSRGRTDRVWAWQRCIELAMACSRPRRYTWLLLPPVYLTHALFLLSFLRLCRVVEQPRAQLRLRRTCCRVPVFLRCRRRDRSMADVLAVLWSLWLGALTILLGICVMRISAIWSYICLRMHVAALYNAHPCDAGFCDYAVSA